MNAARSASRTARPNYPGHTRHVPIKGPAEGYKIRDKRVLLDLDALMPQGRVGLLL